MEKGILTTMISVIIGIIIGVGVVAVRTPKPNTDVVNQLSEINRSLKAIQAYMESVNGQTKVAADFFKDVQAQNLRAQQQRPAPPEEDFSKVHIIDLQDTPVKGDKNAAVTIVEFVDIQCPFCQRFHSVLNEILKAYPTQVNAAFKHYPLPFHPLARPAAKAALAAGEQGKFFEMADQLLTSGNNLTDARFEEIAKQIGLNLDKFKKDLKDKDPRWEELINKDMALGQQIDVRGTPTFYINGRKTMARDLAAFKVEIDAILNEKK